MIAGTRGTAWAWMAAALAAAAVAVAFRASFAGMAFQWQSSSTFSYGVLILPLSVLLIWRERHRLAALPVRPAWFVLGPMAAVAAVWVVGVLADVNVIQHLAAVTMLVLAAWLVVGTAMARAAWFPLAYLLLMVPFGEFLVPTLMQWTADFAVLAVALSGVPVYQDGYVFSLPSGDFEVIKACSGIRFLMATLAAGAIFAWVAYASWQKRLVFLLACLVVPVIGNLLRAYLVVMLVHLSDGRLAGDHVLYGTVFFGAILLAMFLVGARYADRRDGAPPSSPPVPSSPPGGSLVVAVVLAAGVAFAAAALAERAQQQSAVAGPGPGQAPEVPGYVQSPGGAPDWGADVRGASATWSARYLPATGGLPVDLFVGFYGPDSGNGDVTDSRNAPFRPHEWRRTGGEDREGYGETLLRRAPGSAGPDDAARIVWWWYAVTDEATGSRTGAKLRELRALLAGEPPRPAYVALSATMDGQRAEARRALQSFAAAWCRAVAVPCPAGAGGAKPPD